MSKLSVEWKGMLASFTACTLFGLTFFSSKIAFEVGGIAVTLSIRFIIAALTMTLLWRLGMRFAQVRFRALPWKKLLLLGLMEPILYFYGESNGIMLTNSSFASVMIALIPICAMLIALLFLKEYPTVMQTVCSLVSISGVIVISLVGAESGTVNVAGVLWLILAIVAAAVFTVISRGIAQTCSAFERTYIMMLLGAVWFTADALIQCGGKIGLFIAPFGDLSYVGSVLFLGMVASVGAYVLLNYALTCLPVARTMVFTNWTTVVSIIAGVTILHETFTWVQVLGSALILIGLYGVNRFGSKKQTNADADSVPAAADATTAETA